MPAVVSNRCTYRSEHNLVDAQVTNEGLCSKQVVVLDRDAEGQRLDHFCFRSHLDTMVLNAAAAEH
jgi:hypothetical protein